MDQKRLFLAIAISVAILLGFQLLVAPHLPQPPQPPPQQTASTPSRRRRRRPTPAQGSPARGRAAAAPAAPKDVPRLQIAAPRVQGSISLLGARLDDLVLTRLPRDAGAELAAWSGCWSRASDPQPYYVQYRLERRARRAR